MKYDRKEDFLYIKWAAEIKERDKYTCQICGSVNVELHSHHKNGWNLFIEDRYNINCGVTLCSDCHNMFHDIFGRGDNTELQFEEFKIICRAITAAAIKNQKAKKVASEVILKLTKDGYT